MNIDNLAKLSGWAWFAITILGIVFTFALVMIIMAALKVIKSSNIKSKYFELNPDEESKAEEPKENKCDECLKLIEEQKRTMYIAEGKDQLENQCQVAKQLLKELRAKIYTTALQIFNFVDKKDIIIMELISYRIIDRVIFEVKNDLTRNHISTKTNYELEQYTKAKARGYMSMIKDRLFIYNDKLSGFDLPTLMEAIQPQDIESIFKDIYYSARRIVGYNEDSVI